MKEMVAQELKKIISVRVSGLDDRSGRILALTAAIIFLNVGDRGSYAGNYGSSGSIRHSHGAHSDVVRPSKVERQSKIVRPSSIIRPSRALRNGSVRHSGN